MVILGELVTMFFTSLQIIHYCRLFRNFICQRKVSIHINHNHIMRVGALPSYAREEALCYEINLIREYLNDLT